MLVRLQGGLDTPQQNGVGTSGCAECKLIQSQGLTASGNDALLGGLGEPQGGNGDLGEDGKTDVIGDGTDLDNDL